MVTFVPTEPDEGEMLVMCGALTVKFTFCTLLVPLAATLTCPLEAAGGTVATICVSLQLTTDAVTVLKLTELVPCVAPKPLPLICTCEPEAPAVGDTPVTTGLTTFISTL